MAVRELGLSIAAQYFTYTTAVLSVQVHRVSNFDCFFFLLRLETQQHHSSLISFASALWITTVIYIILSDIIHVNKMQSIKFIFQIDYTAS